MLACYQRDARKSITAPCSVFYQVKSLVAVVPEAGVAGKECDMLGDGMGYDDVVAGVAMVLSLVELQVGVGECRVATQG